MAQVDDSELVCPPVFLYFPQKILKHVSYSARFEVISAELIKIKDIWYFTPRRLVNSYGRFGGA